MSEIKSAVKTEPKKKEDTSTTAVLRCICKDSDQDKIYGSGLRLHNKGMTKGKSNNKRKCTVCGNLKTS